MSSGLKALLLSFICSLLVYTISQNVISTVVVFLCVSVILYINEVFVIHKLTTIASDVEDLDNKLEELSEELSESKTLLSYRSELDVGLIHLDGNGKIVYCNEYFSTNVYSEEMDYYQQIKEYSIYKAIFDIYDGKKNINNIKVDDKYFAIKFKVAMGDRKVNSVTIQFYDVTKTETLDILHQNFLVDASHELNNPLSSIIMASEIIDRENKSDFTDILVKESHRMKEVINSIIEHSKLQVSSFDMDTVNLSNLCSSYESLYTSSNVEFKLNIDKEIFVEGNYELLDRMFKNLIDNAFKYTVEGSVIFELKQDSFGVVCNISDTGIGIDKNNIEHIFERFYREDTSRSRETGGSGIGLAIVKEIASLHDIIIDVKTTSVGTSFILRF